MAEALWNRLHAILEVFADRLVATDPMLIRIIGHTANDAFLLRGWLSLRRSPDGDEVAITIEAQSDGQQLVLAADACTDNGQIIAEGPSAAIPLEDGLLSAETRIDDWLSDFERFLSEEEQAVAAAVSKLL